MALGYTLIVMELGMKVIGTKICNMVKAPRVGPMARNSLDSILKEGKME